MSGHSKWSQIKHQKSVTDAAKSRIFARHARLIAFESKRSQGNVSDPSLASAINKAKAANMPKDNIERAVAKGVSKDSGELAHNLYETYGPAGVAILIDAMTDNKNRTTQELKHLLVTHGTEIAPPGSAQWAFTKTGDSYVPTTTLEISGADEEKLVALIEVLDEHEDVQGVFTNATGYENSGD